ncbi:uncharacterized protein LOC135396251 [Ornithodoros turicata]|uniref:uncharacterized protein LOC135396251 n=1 Tax=Ornithodoros turicata TaxID=34597 RepID=UPI00313A2754
MHAVRIILVLFAWTTSQRNAASSFIRRRAVDTLQSKQPPRNLEVDIEESPQWQMENSVRKRRGREGILFIPKPTPSPAPTYYTADQAAGKRCSDDFDCMRVLGQVCKLPKRASTGTCQCPESTPVRVTEHGQPRCVSARQILEDCTDTAECAFLNPYVECVNQICICSPPNVMKRKDLCIPATNTTNEAVHMISVVLTTFGIVGVPAAIIGRIIIAKERQRRACLERLSARSRRRCHRDESQMDLFTTGVRRIFNECKDKIQDMVSRKPAVTPQVEGLSDVEGRPTRTSHEITVEAEVHMADEPIDFEEMASLVSELGRAERWNSEEASTAKTSKSSLTSSNSAGSLDASRVTSRVTSPNAAMCFEDQRPGHVEQIQLNSSAPLSNPADEDERRDMSSSADLAEIVKIVIDQLMKTQSLNILAGHRRSERQDTDDGTMTDAVKAVYSRTLLKMRERLHAMAAQESRSIDQVSLGDSCRTSGPRKETVQRLAPRDKGCGQVKNKTYADVSTLCRILTPHRVRKDQKDPLKRLPVSDAFSEHGFGSNFQEPSIYGLPHLESLLTTFDAFSVMQPSDQLPERRFLLREKQDVSNPTTESYHSCSHPVRLMRRQQKVRTFAPPTTLPNNLSERWEPVVSGANIHDQPRNSLKGYLASNASTRTPATSPSANQFVSKAGQSDTAELSVHELTKSDTRDHGTYSNGALQVREEPTALCSIPKTLLKKPPKVALPTIEDEALRLEAEEETPLLCAETTSRKIPSYVELSILRSPYSRKKEGTVSSQRRTQDSSCPFSKLELRYKSDRSTSKLLNRSFASIHSWTRKNFVQNRTPVEESTMLCSSGPSSEVKEYRKCETEPQTYTGCVYMDPTSSSPPSDIQCPSLFLLDIPREHEIRAKANKVTAENNNETVSAPAAPAEPPTELPGRTRKEIKLAITQNDIIQCLNRIVGSKPPTVPEDNRVFPEIPAKQEAVSGFDLMQDVLLNEDVLNTSQSSQPDGIPKGHYARHKPDVEAFNQPLSRLRRGDLKNMLKEILEEEYSHVLQLSAQAVTSAQSTTAPPVPFEHEHPQALTHDHCKSTSKESSTSWTRRKCSAAKSSSPKVSRTEDRFVTPRSSGEANKTNEFDLQPSTGTQPPYSTGGTLADMSSSRNATTQTITARTTTDTTTQETSSMSTRRFYTDLSFPEIDIDSVPVRGSEGDATKTSKNTTTTATATTQTTENSLTEGGHTQLQAMETTKLLSEVTVSSSSESKMATYSRGTKRFPVAQSKTRLRFSPGKRTHQEYYTERKCYVPRSSKCAPKEYREGKLVEVVPSPEVLFSQPHTSKVATPKIACPDRTSPLVKKKAREGIVLVPSEEVDPIQEKCRGVARTSRTFSSASRAGVKFSSMTSSKSYDSSANGQTHQTCATTIATRTIPKSASFHGILLSDRQDSVDRQRDLVPRSKSYTEYWLKTVSLYKDVPTSQLSPSSGSSDDITERESMSPNFPNLDSEPQLGMSDDGNLESFTCGNQMNPLLRTFLYLQNSAYLPSVTQNTPKSTTYVSYDPKGTLASSHVAQLYQPNEMPNKFRTSTQFQPDTIQANARASFAIRSGADSSIIPASSQHNTAFDTTVLKCDQGRHIYGAHNKRKNFSPDPTTTLAEQASFEDSSSSGPQKSLKKMLRKRAPYRTPFPLCSSSRSSPAAPNTLTMLRRANSAEYATLSKTQSLYRSRVGQPQDVGEEKPLKKCISALSYLERDHLWRQDSLPFQQWLNAARRASLRPVEGDGGSLMDASDNVIVLMSSGSTEEEEMHSLSSAPMQSYLDEEDTSVTEGGNV